MTKSLAHQDEVTSCASLPGCPRTSSVDALAGDFSIDPETKQNNEIFPAASSSLSILITAAKTPILDSDSNGGTDERTTYPAAFVLTTGNLSANAENDSGGRICAEHLGLCVKTMPGQESVRGTEKRDHDKMEVSVDSSNDKVSVDSSNYRKPLCGLSASKDVPTLTPGECDSDAEHELNSTPISALFRTCGSRQSTQIAPDLIGESTEDSACNHVSGSRCQQDSGSLSSQNASSENLGGSIGMVTIAEYPVALTEPVVSAACERGDLVSTVLQVVPKRIQIISEASGISSSDASIMHSDDENAKECEKGRCEVFRDLEAGLPFDVTSSVDEEGMLAVDLKEGQKCSSHVEATKDAVPVADHDPAASCDVKDLVDSELRVPLFAHVQTDDTKSSQDKEASPVGENKLSGDSPEKEPEVHGLRRRRGAKADAIKLSAGENTAGSVKMPEEQKKGVISTRTKDAGADANQEAKQKPMDKKAGKQGKGAAKPAAAPKKVGDSQPLEELRAKEEAETNRKVHESLDNFIRQTIRCEPYMNFTSRPGDKPLQRLRPDVFENHVAGKFARGFKVENGSDPRDIATEENRGVDTYSNDIDGPKDGSTGSAKGITGLGRGAQQSLKVGPPGVVAFTQAAAKGTDLQGWLSPTKTKCEKCAREFCSTLNYRRHLRVHRRSLNPEKEDLSKERSKVAAFWDKLTPEEAGNIVHYDNMEIEDLSGQSAFDALKNFSSQPGHASLPQGTFKAGTWLIDLVQNKAAVMLPSERLLAILDDASERTFLCGGTSVAVQKFVFNNEPGKIGLEEKNLVATMGFHIELNLVKAWMADKEAEALRCQLALFKEEEAAQQKRQKLLEKKRMKKIRQKERKGTTSQLILQEELENESIDDEGNAQGIGEEDDSPTGTGSSSSSLASAQDLALPESAELDETSALAAPSDLMDDRDLGFGEKPDIVKNRSSDEDQPHRHRDGILQYRAREMQEIGSRRGEGLYGEDDPSGLEVGAGLQSRPAADQSEWDGDFDSRTAYPSYQSRSGGRTGEVQSNLYYRRGEQDRMGQDYKKRPDVERYSQDRRPSIRPRRDYAEQKPPRESRAFDRYGDNHPTAFKPVRKPPGYLMRSDSGGNTDLSGIFRTPPYRNKPQNTRAPSSPGNVQGVWTKKNPQPAAAAEPTAKDSQEETIHDDAKLSSNVDGWAAARDAPPEVAMSVPDVADEDVTAPVPEEAEMETKENAAVTPIPLDADSKLAGSGNDVIYTEELMTEEDDEGLSGALLVGSLSVPLGKFATGSMSQARSGSNHHRDDSEVVPGVSGSIYNPDTTQSTASKSQLSSPSPERGENSRPNSATIPVGYERSALKAGGSWQTPAAGRYVPAKMWRAIGVVAERQDLSRPASGDGAPSDFMEARLSDDLDVSGRSEGEIETFAEADYVRQSSPAREQEYVQDDWQGPRFSDDPRPIVTKTGEYQSNLSAFSAPFRPASMSAPVLVTEKKSEVTSKVDSDDVVESIIPAVGLSLSYSVEVAESFFNERWKTALAHASIDEVLRIDSDSTEGERLNFLDIVSQQMSEEYSRHSPSSRRELGQSSSTVVTELSGKSAHQGVLLSKIFNDTDQTGVQDIRRPSAVDEEGLDGCSPQESHSSEDDTTGLRDASTSPIGSDYMSGGEMVSSAPSAGGGNCPEWGGGAVGSSYPRRGNSRQERWHRNRFSEQKYMARRRGVPVERNC